MKTYVYLRDFFDDYDSYCVNVVMVSDVLSFVNKFCATQIEEWEDGQKQRSWTYGIFTKEWTEDTV